MKQKHLFLIILTALITSFTSLQTHAGNVYKWTDKNGTVHYGDIRPDDVNSETVKVNTKHSKATAPRPSLKSQVDAVDEKEKNAAEKKQEQAQEQLVKKQQQQRCEQARANAQAFIDNPRVQVEENGEIRYLTPEEFSEKKAETDKVIQESCTNQ